MIFHFFNSVLVVAQCVGSIAQIKPFVGSHIRSHLYDGLYKRIQRPLNFRHKKRPPDEGGLSYYEESGSVLLSHGETPNYHRR
jgi:hypothetical protein